MTLEEVGAKVNVTRERIRQLEFYTLKKLPRKARELLKGVG
jgi:DNA-directed RNA polymerase sigma subunit (sigma70/sigma32)